MYQIPWTDKINHRRVRKSRMSYKNFDLNINQVNYLITKL